MGFSQARILELVAISFSRGTCRPRDWTQVSCISCIGRQILYHWATRRALYGCESWTIKKAECWKMDAFDAFELWCWRRLLRVPWTARRSSQFILKEISPEYSLEGLMLKLKLQYFGHLMWRAVSLEKILMLGKTEGRKIKGRQRMRWLDGISNLMDMSLSKLLQVGDEQGGLACCSPWGHKESDTTEWLNWTELKWLNHRVTLCLALSLASLPVPVCFFFFFFLLLIPSRHPTH